MIMKPTKSFGISFFDLCLSKMSFFCNFDKSYPPNESELYKPIAQVAQTSVVSFFTKRKKKNLVRIPNLVRHA